MEGYFLNKNEVFDLVADFGVTMLSAGGEISRTKATMENVAKVYGITEFSVYIIANGIFLTGKVDGKFLTTKINEVPISSTNLSRVEDINNLSREISKGDMSAQDAAKELEKIKKHIPYTFLITTLAMGAGCGSFCYLFKGTFFDCAIVFVIGSLLSIFLNYINKHSTIPKIIKNLFASSFVALICCFCYYIHLGSSLSAMIIGCIMPLVPGIPLTNAVRHFFDDDYLSGVIRLADAFLTALSVGMGVGIIILIWHNVMGGILI